MCIIVTSGQSDFGVSATPVYEDQSAKATRNWWRIIRGYCRYRAAFDRLGGEQKRTTRLDSKVTFLEIVRFHRSQGRFCGFKVLRSSSSSRRSGERNERSCCKVSGMGALYPEMMARPSLDVSNSESSSISRLDIFDNKLRSRPLSLKFSSRLTSKLDHTEQL